MGSPTPMVRPLDDSQRPSPFHGHGSWLVCEVALSVFSRVGMRLVSFFIFFLFRIMCVTYFIAIWGGNMSFYGFGSWGFVGLEGM
jgi:hypothetical protein